MYYYWSSLLITVSWKKHNIIISFLWCVGVNCGACIFNGLQVRARLNIQLYEDTHIHIYMHRHTELYPGTLTHACLHAHVHTHTHNHMYACTHACSCTHTHTRTRTYPPPPPCTHTHTHSLSVSLTFPPKGSRLYVTAVTSWGWSLSSARQISELTW